MVGQPPTNGYPLQANEMHLPGRPVGHEGRLRTLSVREALPFTPFSSIVPFNPGMSAPSKRHVSITCLACSIAMNSEYKIDWCSRDHTSTYCDATLQRRLRLRLPCQHSSRSGPIERWRNKRRACFKTGQADT